MSSSEFAARAQSAGDRNDQSNGRGEIGQDTASGGKTSQQEQ
jgi:hypothetical protein